MKSSSGYCSQVSHGGRWCWRNIKEGNWAETFQSLQMLFWWCCAPSTSTTNTEGPESLLNSAGKENIEQTRILHSHDSGHRFPPFLSWNQLCVTFFFTWLPSSSKIISHELCQPVHFGHRSGAGQPPWDTTDKDKSILGFSIELALCCMNLLKEPHNFSGKALKLSHTQKEEMTCVPFTRCCNTAMTNVMWTGFHHAPLFLSSLDLMSWILEAVDTSSLST